MALNEFVCLHAMRTRLLRTFLSIIIFMLLVGCSFSYGQRISIDEFTMIEDSLVENARRYYLRKFVVLLLVYLANLTDTMSSQYKYINQYQEELLLEKLSNRKYRVVVLLMLHAGLRVSEAVTLKYSNFNFRTRTVTVKSLKKKGATKKREIPLSDALYQALLEYTKHQGSVDKDSYLFPVKHKSNQNQHMARRAVNTYLRRFITRHSELSYLHPHMFRHTFATRLRENGEGIETVKDLLGHENIATTTIYAHITPKESQSAIAKFNKDTRPFWQKVKEKVLPPPREVINIRTTRETFTVGREAELLQLTTNVSKHINTILLGGTGNGKTHLMDSLFAQTGRFLRIDDLSDIKNTLKGLILYLAKGDKEQVISMIYKDTNDLDVKISKESIKNLTELVISLTTRHEYTIIIDSLDRITPRGVKLLEQLKDHFTIVAAAREIAVNKSTFLWNFESIRLDNLSRTHALQLIQEASAAVQVDNWDLYRNHILRAERWQPAGDPGADRPLPEGTDRHRRDHPRQAALRQPPGVRRHPDHYSGFRTAGHVPLRIGRAGRRGLPPDRRRRYGTLTAQPLLLFLHPPQIHQVV